MFNRCFHFEYGDTAMWLKCVRHPKNAKFTQNVGMNTTPAYIYISLQYMSDLLQPYTPTRHIRFAFNTRTFATPGIINTGTVGERSSFFFTLARLFATICFKHSAT